jgi:hypothetical protein
MGQPWRDSLERTDGTGHFGQYHWNKAAETTENGQDGMTGHLGQYREDGNARKRQTVQDGKCMIWRKLHEKSGEFVKIFTKICLENH